MEGVAFAAAGLPSRLPHSSQKTRPGGFSVRQLPHVSEAARVSPQTPQNLAESRFSSPQERQFKVGSPSDYPAGTVTTKWKSEFGVWIVHTESKGQNLIYALFSICTHLGCTPNWLESEQKFKCPCHGSGFYISGVNFEGPAPRPLERTAIRIAPDGMLEVDKSRKFQQEMGQWDDPASFVEMA